MRTILCFSISYAEISFIILGADQSVLVVRLRPRGPRFSSARVHFFAAIACYKNAVE